MTAGERQERPDPEAPGEKGAILRREGLYSSLITEWRRTQDADAPARSPGRPAADLRDAQIAHLQKEKAKLEQELAEARFGADAQSKLQAWRWQLPRGTPSTRHALQFCRRWSG